MEGRTRAHLILQKLPPDIAQHPDRLKLVALQAQLSVKEIRALVREFSRPSNEGATGGMEEARSQAENFMRTLVQEASPHGLIPVVIGSGLEKRYPELRVLGKFPDLPVVMVRDRSAEDIAMELINRWDAHWAIFAGFEGEAGRYLTIFKRARIATMVITPQDSTQAILSILAQAAGLEEATLVARKGFGQFMDDLTTLGRQL